MEPPVCCVPRLRVRAKPGFKRYVRILVRIAIRRLFRTERIATDARGIPKPNPIRWIV